MSSKYVGKIKIGNNVSPIGTTLLGTCDTLAGTQVKEVEFDGDSFQSYTDNITIKVKFEDTNTAANPKLKIVYDNGQSSTSEVSIRTYDAGVPGVTPKSSWYAGEVVTFTYIVNNSEPYWYMSPKGGVDVQSQNVVTGIATTNTTFELNNTTLNITTTAVTPDKVNINTLIS